MKKYYETKIDIGSKILSAQEIMHVLEDAANGDTARLGLNFEGMIRKYRAFWMLARCIVRLDKPVIGPGELICRTCHRGFNGVLAYRDYDLLLNGEKLGEVVQVWIISDIATRKMLRPDSLPGFDLPDSEDPRDTQIAKIKAPKELKYAGTYIVSPEDIDGNGHMNNTRYLGAAQSVLDEDFKAVSFQVGFLKESMLGDRISLYRADTDAGIYIRGCHDNGTACFDVLFFDKNEDI
ncbi:MAG: hypothetical protein E7430_06485 [Ruminococcaceae bacterium]|nr:hypothetical protein [Oscillospiraceae bacterium]